MTLENLLDKVEDRRYYVSNFDKNKTYLYRGKGGLFDSEFTFKIVDENLKGYIIEVANQRIYLEKTFELFDAIADGEIVALTKKGEQIYDNI